MTRLTVGCISFILISLVFVGISYAATENGYGGIEWGATIKDVNAALGTSLSLPSESRSEIGVGKDIRGGHSDVQSDVLLFVHDIPFSKDSEGYFRFKLSLLPERFKAIQKKDRDVLVFYDDRFYAYVVDFKVSSYELYLKELIKKHGKPKDEKQKEINRQQEELKRDMEKIK